MTAATARRRFSFGLLPWLAVAAVVAQDPAVWSETFSSGRLDPSLWQITTSGPARHREAYVVEQPPAAFRLALTAETRGTADETVTTVGVRTVARLSLTPSARLAFDLDWNDQENGSYLSGGAVLAPHRTSGDALALGDWLKVEYVGVPPGRHARMVIAAKSRGRERTLFTEGWPEQNRTGRPIRRQHVALVVRNGHVEVRENDALVYASTERLISFSDAHVYLRLSSHSNYPPRTLLFGPIRMDRPVPGSWRPADR